MDFFDPQQFPAPHAAEADAEYPVVPTLRSGMSELVENLSKIAGNLNKVDFAGLSQELKSLLATANQQVGGLDLKKMVATVTAAASSIDALAGSAEAKAAFANLNKTATEVQGLVAKLDTQVEPVSAELVRSLHSFHDAAESVHKSSRPAKRSGRRSRQDPSAVDGDGRIAATVGRFSGTKPERADHRKKAPRQEP